MIRSNNVKKTFFIFVVVLLGLVTTNFKSSCAIIGDNSLSASTTQQAQGYVRAPVIYGLVHMAKTAGSEINGLLALNYERVCGNKGYSYDYTRLNQRMEILKQTQNNLFVDDAKERGDVMVRGHPMINIMHKIGFEDCDYIAVEEPALIWNGIAQRWPMELHVPCRERLQHFMSQCNFFGVNFDCAAKDLKQEVGKCLNGFHHTRFNEQLTKHENITVKCFNPIPVDSYVGYMSQLLQPKRIQSNYVHRASNKPRHEQDECIWQNPNVASQVKQILLEGFNGYYKFCDQCMGSDQELFPTSKE